MPPCYRTSRTVLIVLSVWCLSALALGAVGAFAALRPPLPQVVLFGLVALLLTAFWSARKFRSWLYDIPLQWLISAHLVRFVGIYFLWLYRNGRLPFAFAVPGGCGDILTASLALLLLLFSRSRPLPVWLYWAWNTIGFIDILFVVTTAAKLALADAASMSALLQLPLSLLPTFFVPLIIFTHLVMFVRLKNAGAITSP